jgi:hypothetical protein
MMAMTATCREKSNSRLPNTRLASPPSRGTTIRLESATPPFHPQEGPERGRRRNELPETSPSARPAEPADETELLAD